MDAQDMILADITWKQLIWYGHVEGMDQYNYQELWFTGNLKEGNNEDVPGEPGKVEYIQPWMKEI
jgi:hypothetical protein